MVTIFKSQATQFVYIKGVTHSFAEDFGYIRDGDIFTITTTLTGLTEVACLDYTKFIGKDSSDNDITFADADELEQYLILTFTQVPLIVGSSIYGNDLNIFKNDNILTNSSTTPVTVISNTTSVLDVGVYEIEVCYSWNHNSTKSDFQSFLFFDGQVLGVNPTGLIHKEEPKDSAGNFMSTGSLQHLSFYKKFIVDLTVGGAKNVLFQFNTDMDGCSSSIFETLIKIKRIN